MPIFAPIAVQLGFDPVAFAIMGILAIECGLLTPPFGMVLFVLNRISGVSLHRIVVAVTPFLIPLLAVSLLLLFFPWLVTALPRLIM